MYFKLKRGGYKASLQMRVSFLACLSFSRSLALLVPGPPARAPLPIAPAALELASDGAEGEGS